MAETTSAEEKKEIYDRLKSFSKNEIIEKLQIAGITNAGNLDEDDFRLLKSGRYCHTVVGNNFSEKLPEEILKNCDTAVCKVKMVYVPEKNDFYVNKKFAQLELNIPESYLGVKIDADLKNQLEKYNNIGVHTIVNEAGKESKGYISIDKDLKTLMFVPTGNAFIPDKLGENPITQRQKDSLKAGFSVSYKDYINKDGDIKPTMNLKLSPFIEGKITFSDGVKKTQKETIEQTQSKGLKSSV